MRLLRNALVVGLAACVVLPAALEAQEVRVIPWVGLYAPASDLGEASDGSVSGAIEYGEKESTFAFGAALEFGRRDQSLGFRIGAAYASESDVPVGGISCTGSTCDTRSSLLAATGDLVFRPIPRLLVVQPYLLGGVGVKRYDFETDEGVASLADDQSKLAGHLGVGAQISLGILSFNVEISDYVSGVELAEDEDGDTQHDLFFTVGLVF